MPSWTSILTGGPSGLASRADWSPLRDWNLAGQSLVADRLGRDSLDRSTQQTGREQQSPVLVLVVAVVAAAAVPIDSHCDGAPDSRCVITACMYLQSLVHTYLVLWVGHAVERARAMDFAYIDWESDKLHIDLHPPWQAGHAIVITVAVEARNRKALAVTMSSRGWSPGMTRQCCVDLRYHADGSSACGPRGEPHESARRRRRRQYRIHTLTKRVARGGQRRSSQSQARIANDVMRPDNGINMRPTRRFPTLELAAG